MLRATFEDGSEETDLNRLRSVLEATGDGLWEWNVVTGEVNFSPQWYAMLGYEPNGFPVSHESWTGLIHQDDKGLAEKAVQEHFEGKSERFEAEFRLKCKNGHWKWVLGRGKVVQRDEIGKPLRLIGTHQDIHERKLQGYGVSNRSSFFETLLKTIPCPVFYKDREGVYRGCNEAFLKQILGLPYEKVLGSTIYDLPEAIPRELADVYHKKDMELIDAPGHQTYEAHVQCADGIRRDYVFNKATVYDGVGQASGIVGVMMDVTERKRAETEAWAMREKLENILHSIPVGIAIIDKSSQKIVEVNPVASMMIGLPEEQIVGHVCHQFICPAEKGKCPILDLGMEINRSERELLTSGGDAIPILKTVIPFVVENREYLLECFKDIQDLKEAEKERVEKEKLQSVIEMAGSVCHEMNQPLQAILGFSELIIMELDENEKISGMLKTINKQAHRINATTKKLSNITRYQTKKYLNGNIIDIDNSSPSMHKGSEEIFK